MRTLPGSIEVAAVQEIKILCPCGYAHRVTGDVDGDWRRWVTIRDRDYMDVIDAEVRRRDIAGTGLPPDNDPRANEHTDLTWVIIDRSGQLLDCPACGRILWRRPGEADRRVFRPE
jgi:hypothetical protein